MELQRQSCIISPQGTETKMPIFHRKDKLTGRYTTICPVLAEKWVGNINQELLQKLVNDSKGWCPFCKDLSLCTPSTSYAKNGRWFREGVCVFPNLYPRMEFEGVVTSSAIHSLWLTEFTTLIVFNFLKVSIEAITDVFNSKSSLSYAVIGMNYLPPAGASLVHPHMQISMRDFQFATPSFIEAAIHNNNNTSYSLFSEIMNTIKIAGRVRWGTPYAPSGFNEVWGVLTNTPDSPNRKLNLISMTNEEIKEIADGISKILLFYNSRGLSSFNISVSSSKLHDDDNSFAKLLVDQISKRIILVLMVGEQIIPEAPEDTAKELSKFLI